MFAQPPPIKAPGGDETLELCNPFTSLDCLAKTVVIVSTVGAAGPILTDPGVLSTAATGAGLYGLTQLGGCGGPFSWISCNSLPALRLASSTNFATTLNVVLVDTV